MEGSKFLVFSFLFPFQATDGGSQQPYGLTFTNTITVSCFVAVVVLQLFCCSCFVAVVLLFHCQ